MTPKIVDKTQKKKMITQTAIHIFAEKGVSQTKMTDIAEAAMLGKGTLYEYFTSKDELLTAAFQEFFAQLDEIIFIDFEQVQSVSQKIRRVFSAFHILSQSHFVNYFPLLLEAWTISSREKTSIVRQYLVEKYNVYKEMMTSWIEEGIEQGEFRAVPAESIAQMLIAMGDGLFLYWILLKDNFPIDSTVQVALDTVLTGLQKQ